MPNLNAQGVGASPIDTGAVTVNDASNWVQVGIVQLNGAKREALLMVSVGAGGALGHLKLTRAVAAGGTHVDWLVDTDFNTATDELMDCVTGTTPPNLYQLGAGLSGMMKLAELSGIIEVGIWAKKATNNTTLQVTGNFV